MISSHGAVFTALLAAVGCSGGLTDVACTDDFRYGLNVTVTDAATGLPPEEATLIASGVAFHDSVGPAGPFQRVSNGPLVLILSTAGERPGLYYVVVRSPSYRDWTLGPIRVTADRCHVRPVNVAAPLEHQ